LELSLSVLTLKTLKRRMGKTTFLFCLSLLYGKEDEGVLFQDMYCRVIPHILKQVSRITLINVGLIIIIVF
jgi:hypothetical protein